MKTIKRKSKSVRASNWKKRSAWGLLSLIFAGFLIPSLIGVDFGSHWDEGLHMWDVKRNIKEGYLAPRTQVYPGMIYWLIYAPSAVARGKREIASLFTGKLGTPETRREILSEGVTAHNNWLLVRGIFIFWSGMAILWAFLAGRAYWGRDSYGLVAAAIVGFSWEFAYHARYIACDAIHTSAITLQLFLIVIALSKKNPWRWLYYSAAAAGLAAASKYTGAAAILPALAMPWLHPTWKTGAQEKAEAVAAVLLCFTSVYLVLSPGILVYPSDVITMFGNLHRTYAKFGHVGHTLNAGIDHLNHLVQYLFLYELAPYRPVSLCFALLTLLGVYAGIRKNRRATLNLLVFPLFYGLYFSTQRVMIVRNYLVLLPYLAFFAAGGAAYLWTARFPVTIPRRAMATALFVAFFANAAFLFYAGWSIKHPGESVERALAYMRSHPEKRFLVGPWVKAAIPADAPLTNLVENAEQPYDEAIFRVRDAKNRLDLICYKGNLYDYHYGPYEVNINYYSNWNGQDHVVRMSRDKMQRHNVTF